MGETRSTSRASETGERIRRKPGAICLVLATVIGIGLLAGCPKRVVIECKNAGIIGEDKKVHGATGLAKDQQHVYLIRTDDQGRVVCAPGDEE